MADESSSSAVTEIKWTTLTALISTSDDQVRVSCITLGGKEVAAADFFFEAKIELLIEDLVAQIDDPFSRGWLSFTEEGTEVSQDLLLKDHTQLILKKDFLPPSWLSSLDGLSVENVKALLKVMTAKLVEDEEPQYTAMNFHSWNRSEYPAVDLKELKELFGSASTGWEVKPGYEDALDSWREFVEAARRANVL